MRLLGCILLLLGCAEQEHCRGCGEIASLKVISAYVLGSSVPAGCNLDDPESWGANFTYHPRCVPDLLNWSDAQKTFVYDAQIRVVFSEGFADSSVDPNGKLGPVVAANAGPLTVPINFSLSHYDPTGADFKQGIYGTAPPGPAIVVDTGDGVNVVGFPSGQTAKICFDPVALRDTAGNALVGDNCISITIEPLTVKVEAPNQTPFDIRFSAPIPNATLSTTSLFELRLDNALIAPTCYTLEPNPNTRVTGDSSLGASLVLTCPTTAASGTLLVRGTIADQYGVQLGADTTLFFSVPPPPPGGNN